MHARELLCWLTPSWPTIPGFPLSISVILTRLQTSFCYLTVISMYIFLAALSHVFTSHSASLFLKNSFKTKVHFVAGVCGRGHPHTGFIQVTSLMQRWLTSAFCRKLLQTSLREGMSLSEYALSTSVCFGSIPVITTSMYLIPNKPNNASSCDQPLPNSPPVIFHTTRNSSATIQMQSLSEFVGDCIEYKYHELVNVCVPESMSEHISFLYLKVLFSLGLMDFYVDTTYIFY